MDIGMIWFDNDKKSELDAKVKRAASYYRGKYGKKPNVCFLNPVMLPDDIDKVDGIALNADPEIIPDHLWMGVENEKSC